MSARVSCSAVDIHYSPVCSNPQACDAYFCMLSSLGVASTGNTSTWISRVIIVMLLVDMTPGRDSFVAHDMSTPDTTSVFSFKSEHNVFLATFHYANLCPCTHKLWQARMPKQHIHICTGLSLGSQYTFICSCQCTMSSFNSL